MSADEELNESWAIFTVENDHHHLEEYVTLFLSSYGSLIDATFSHLEKGIILDGPDLTSLPSNLLQVLHDELSSYSGQAITDSLHENRLKFTGALLQVICVLCRKYENIALVSSCEFLRHVVPVINFCIKQFSSENSNIKQCSINVFRHGLLFIECMYDPSHFWRRQLANISSPRNLFRPRQAILSQEIVPFFYDCLQETTWKKLTTTNCHEDIIHMLGAILMGSKENAMLIITPPTLDVLFQILSSRPPDWLNEDGYFPIKLLALRCFIQIVQVSHTCRTEQRQVGMLEMLKQMMVLLGDSHGEPRLQAAILRSIPDSLRLTTIFTLQFAYLNAGLLRNMIHVLQKNVDNEDASDDIPYICVCVISAIINGNHVTKNVFKDLLGFPRLGDLLLRQGHPSSNLISALFNMMVETNFTKDTKCFILNAGALAILLKLLPEVPSSEDQNSIVDSICHISMCYQYNRMLCCSEGIMGFILDCMDKHDKLDGKVQGKLISLIEELGSYSITSSQLKHLISLMRGVDDDSLSPLASIWMHCISTIARKEIRRGASHYFDFQDEDTGILIPSIPRWPGHGFTFHAWVCLNSTPISETLNKGRYRRQLYSFFTQSGSGFEAFFTLEGVLVIAVCVKKETVFTTLTDVPITDNGWHSITVCHQSAWRPFGQSQLIVFIDGLQQHTSPLKFPSTSEEFVTCSIGHPRVSKKMADEEEEEDLSIALNPAKAKLKSLSDFTKKISFKRKSLESPSRGRSPSEVDGIIGNIPSEMKDLEWGVSRSLQGQVGSACVFSEALSPIQVKKLYFSGPNELCNFQSEDNDMADLKGKLLIFYHAKACRQNKCADLAHGIYDGDLFGSFCGAWDLKDVINCIGGVQVLFPILELVTRESPATSAVQSDAALSESSEGERSPTSWMDEDEWEVVQSNHRLDAQIEKNKVAGFLTLLKNICIGHHINQELLHMTHGIATIGALLQRVDSKLIDVNVLMAIQLFVESVCEGNSGLMKSAYRYLLFDFRIWSKSDFTVRIGHIQYLSTIVKDSRKKFRKLYGIQFLLDVVRTYYSSRTCDLPPCEAKAIRHSFFGLAKYFAYRGITDQELKAVLGFIFSVDEETLICEALDMLFYLLETPGGGQLYLLLCEENAANLMYALLPEKEYSEALLHKVFKIFSHIMKTTHVQDKNKGRIRLMDVGYSGLTLIMDNRPIKMSVAKYLVDQNIDAVINFPDLLAVLQLFQNCSCLVKLEACTTILDIIYKFSFSVTEIAKLHGWQDTLVRLLIKTAVNESTPVRRRKYTPRQRIRSDGSFHNATGLSMTSNTSDNNSRNGKEDSQSKNGIHARPSSLILANNCIQTSYPNEMGDGFGGPFSPMLETQPLHSPGPTPHEYADEDSIWTNADDSNGGSEVSQSHTGPKFASVRPDHLNLVERSRASSIGSSSIENVSREEKPASSSSSSHSSPMKLTTKMIKGGLRLVRSSTDVNPSSEDTQEEMELLTSVELKEDESLHMVDEVDREGVEETVEEMIAIEKTCDDFVDTLVKILTHVMWKGVRGGDEDAWIARAQVFKALSEVAASKELFCPPNRVKRAILEQLLICSIEEVRSSHLIGEENSLWLIRLTYDFIFKESGLDAESWSLPLVNKVIELYDALQVWELTSRFEWKEVTEIGLRLLLQFAAHENIDICAVATAKLHYVLQTRKNISPIEACFLLGSLDSSMVLSFKESKDTYTCLVPILKCMIELFSDQLSMRNFLPNLPTTGVRLYEDIEVYCQGEEWRTYIDKQVLPFMHEYITVSYADLSAKMSKFWRKCFDHMNTGIHKRERERGESKLKFQAQILGPFNDIKKSDLTRHASFTNQLCNQHQSTLRQWRASKRFLIGERGAWAEKNPQPIFWKLSSQENFSRMRLKLTQNYSFDPHIEASNERDNIGTPQVESQNLLSSELVKEARVSDMELQDDRLGDEEWNFVNSETTGDEQGTAVKEKTVISEECDLITLVDVIPGKLEVTTTHVYFYDNSVDKDEGSGQDFKWSLSHLREVHLRRYNLRRSAIEIFFINQTNYFINFKLKKVRNKTYGRILNLKPPNVYYTSAKSPAELLKASGLTLKWVNREISNFDYLMQLNTIAGRTYNDLSQYPVFPWILSDYESETLDLTDSGVYRDLSKPIGVNNPANVEEVKAKFESLDESSEITSFHYGTHYSNAAGVMHYLVRLEPFTTLHIQLQSGKFDCADRQFHSLASTWETLMKNPNDVKELIPEFFYLPEFLVNSNNFDLGLLQQTKEGVNDVILPKWAKSTEDFIYKHRQALESDHVSAHLHDWIDLIFGFKQRGQAAVEALNVFYYCTYEGAVDLDTIKNPIQRQAVEGMINNFGQTPCQLLHDPHPKRKTVDEIQRKGAQFYNLFDHLGALKAFFVEVSSKDKDSLVYVRVPKSQTKFLFYQGMPDTMITISDKGTFGCHGWLPYDKTISNYFTFDRDSTLFSSKIRKSVSGPFAPGLRITSSLFVATHDAKLLITGGHWDNSLRVVNMKGKMVAHVARHLDVVTCLALDSCGMHLITGSRDTSCMIWEITYQGGFSSGINNRPIQTLYGHDDEVTCVALSSELDMAASASKDGSVIIHTILKGHYIRTLRPPIERGLQITMPCLAISDEGHIIVHCRQLVGKKTYEELCSMHVYSINGKHLCSDLAIGSINGMEVVNEYLITGDDKGFLTIRKVFGLEVLSTIPLQIPIHSLSVVPTKSHILIGLRDGKLIIVGVDKPAEIKKLLGTGYKSIQSPSSITG